MKPVFLRPASVADLRRVGSLLKGPDRVEVEAAVGIPAEAALLLRHAQGLPVLAGGLAARPEEPMLLCGCDPVMGHPDVGVVWLLTTPEVYDHPVELVKSIKDMWERYHSQYETLTNFTLCENTRHHKLLRWLGAKIVRRVDKFGAAGLPFYEFASVR